MGLILGLILVPVLAVAVFLVWQAAQAVRHRRGEWVAPDDRAGGRREAQQAARRRAFVEESDRSNG